MFIYLSSAIKYRIIPVNLYLCFVNFFFSIEKQNSDIFNNHLYTHNASCCLKNMPDCVPNKSNLILNAFQILKLPTTLKCEK